MNDIFLPNFIDLWTNLRNKFFFNFNKCYNCLRIRRISIGEKTRRLEVLARYWSPASRETVNSPNKKERERERVGGASPPIWTSATFRPTSRTDPLGGAACFKKCSVAELFMTRFLFGYGRPSPTLHTGGAEGRRGLLVKTFARWIRNTRCRLPVKNKRNHRPSSNNSSFPRKSSTSSFEFRRFRICANTISTTCVSV